MRRIFVPVLLLFLVLTSCARAAQPTPREILDRILAALPQGAGVIYDSTLPAHDPQHLDPLLLRALYARPDGSDDREDIAAVVLFLGASAVSQREIGIFACRGSDAAREVAALCRARAALLAAELGVSPRILVYGTTVVLLSLPDPSPAVSLLDRLLG